MPNSGYHGQINNKFEGFSKHEIFPLNQKYTNQNLPNPAFWHVFVRDMASAPSGQMSRTRGSSRSMFSRHMTSQPSQNTWTGQMSSSLDGPPIVPYSEPHPPQHNPFPSVLRGGIIANSVAPFSTLSKPTCGYFFSRLTDQKKRRSGIPPADLVQWRYYVK